MNKKKQIKPGDVVLLYCNLQPQAYLHIVKMTPDLNCVSGVGWHITLRRLEIPMIEFSFLLNEDHLKDGFYQNGIPMSLQLVSTIPEQVADKPIEKSEKSVDVIDNNTLF